MGKKQTLRQRKAEEASTQLGDNWVSPFQDLKVPKEKLVETPVPPPPPPPTKEDLQRRALSPDDQALLDVFGGDIALDRSDGSKHKERVQLRRERKGHGGKEVTVVSGLEGMDTVVQMELCASIKTTLGIGGRFYDGVLELQGDQRIRAQKWFEEHGFSAVVH